SGKRTGVSSFDLEQFSSRLKLARLAEGVLVRRAFVRNQVDITPNIADQEIDSAISVPIDGMYHRSRTRDGNRLLSGALYPLAVVLCECSLGCFLELPVSGDQYAVGFFAYPAANVDNVAVFVLEHFGRRELALRTATEQENFTGPRAR